MGFDLLALSNNHAWDLGTEGILATRDAVIAAGFTAAGTGANLTAASAAGVWPRHGGVALVAAASGKLHDGAAATADRAGVNELRLDSNDVINAADRDRMLESIASAAHECSYVIAYLHNHQWGDDMRRTRPWVRQFARDCVAAGASVFVSHGAPLLHGIEMHMGKPLLHGIGSLVFHSRTAPGYYRAEVWQSAIVQLAFDGGELIQLEVVPVSMNEYGEVAARPLQTRGRPRIATGSEAETLLTRLARLSADFGTELRIDGNRAVLV
jgi:poly-gamma-glutamate synthesis protein (capsule biosynthesis protein)